MAPQEHDYRRLFERVLDGVYLATRAGRILDANPAMIEMLGYESLEDLQAIDLGRDLYEDPGQRLEWQRQLESAGQVRDLEITLKRKDGKRIVVLESASVVRDDAGGHRFYEGTLTDITERKRAEDVQSVLLYIFRAATAAKDLRDFLATTRSELSRLIDTSNFYVALFDQESQEYSFPYHVDERHSNDPANEEPPLGLTDYVRRTGTALLADEAAQDELRRTGEIEQTATGAPVWLGVPLETDGDVLGVLAVQGYGEHSVYSQQDVELLTLVADNLVLAVERMRTELDLRRSEQNFRALFEASPDAIFVEDPDGNVLDVNPAAEALHGVDREGLVGKNIRDLVPANGLADVLERHQQLLEGEPTSFEDFARLAEGRVIPVEIRSSAFDFNGEPAVLLHVHDITERKAREARLEQLARFDSLTELPNRFLFEDRLNQAIFSARRSGERMALHYLDLDQFKEVNDSFGHAVGDDLLVAVAGRLRQIVRDTDTIARLGGDEFAIIQPGVKGATSASALAVRILEGMLQPFDIAGRELHIGASIGIALSTEREVAEELVQQADRALYKAKEQRGAFRFHDESLSAEVDNYVSVRRDLVGAVERDEFLLEYQPQIDLRSGEVIGAEALVRWRHPERGLLMPDDFVPTTEQTALVIPIETWALEQACRQRREWCDAGLKRVPTAVNLSAVQFRDPHFAQTILGVINRTRVRPYLLELELNETILIQGSDVVRQTLIESSAHGISIALDDFGTGYSSLQYLRQFPIQKLKIAMQFVHGMTEDPNDAAIVAAVIGLGHRLGLRVIAEGVETEEQLKFLRDHGCNEAQGFYFSRPLPAGEFAKMLSQH